MISHEEYLHLKARAEKLKTKTLAPAQLVNKLVEKFGGKVYQPQATTQDLIQKFGRKPQASPKS